ncbi:MAG: hypothetical protein HYU39_01555 [Thaumarchaeota archaeon]|nr:hypothetical protein [Nitrososphaerota archaeon]
MAKKPKLDTDKVFEAFYLLGGKGILPDKARLSTREISEKFKKDYGLEIDHTNISRAVARLTEQFVETPSLEDDFQAWVARVGQSGKVFYKTDPVTNRVTSDYVSVQDYIDRRVRSPRGPGDMIDNLKMAEKCWLFLDKKDPANWEEKDVLRYLAEGRTLEHKPHTAGTKLSYLGACRQVAPKAKVKDGTKDFKRENRRQNPIIHSPVFLKEFKEILASDKLTDKEKFVFKLHVVLGCREGYDNPKASLLGLNWEECYNPRTERIRVFESKAVGWWENIPLDALDPQFKDEFRRHWERRGRPSRGYILDIGETPSQRRKFLQDTYAKIRRSFPFTASQKFTPHFGRKTHANILWELGYPSEVIIGEATSGEGYVGAGETDLSTYQKYYLSLAKSKLEQYRKKAAENFYKA